MTDRGPSVDFTTSDCQTQMDCGQAELAHFVYEDHLCGIAAGPEPEARHKVPLLLNQWRRLFEEDILFLHKATVDLEQESLGIQFSGSQLGCGITRRRFWRLCAAIEDLLHRRKCCSWVINVIVGHATFCCFV